MIHKALGKLHDYIMTDKEWLDKMENDVLTIKEYIKNGSLTEANFHIELLQEKIKTMQTDFEKAINQIRI